MATKTAAVAAPAPLDIVHYVPTDQVGMPPDVCSSGCHDAVMLSVPLGNLLSTPPPITSLVQGVPQSNAREAGTWHVPGAAPAPAPTATAVAPTDGPAAGGTQITITGSGFKEGL